MSLTQLIARLESTQWTAPEQIASSQCDQLQRLATYANQHSPYFAWRLERAGLRPADLAIPGGLARLPVLTRRDVQTAGIDLFCQETPAQHGGVHPAQTSGSTGEPVVIRKTELSTFVWQAMTMRDHRWHQRNLAGRLCSVRAGIDGREPHADWGPPASLLASTGPALSLPITTGAGRLTHWIADFAPDYLILYPSTMSAVAAYCREHGVSLPSLRQIRTVGETLHSSGRASAVEVFGVPVIDCYSSKEIGYVALACPESGLYHVMSEGVIAEVLGDDGQPCAPGQIGRVTITDLHNFATPMVRYDIGDYAEVATPCRCGRNLPTWTRIVGRERNLVLLPDGTRYWPVTGFANCRDIAPILQYQLIQHDRRTIEARLVTERPLSAAEEDTLRAHFALSIGHQFALGFSYVSGRIPPAASGKFEEFICRASPSMPI